MSDPAAEGLRRAAALLQSGDAVAAAAKVRAVLSAHPNHFAGRHLMALIGHALNENEGSLALLRVLHSERPSDAAVLENLALAERRAGHGAAALEALKSLIELTPQSATAWSRLAASQLDAGDEQLAEQSFRRAISIRPHHLEALEGLGRFLEARGRLDELSALLEDAPHSTMIALLRGQLAARTGDAVEATALFQSVLRSGDAPPAQRALAAARLGRALESQAKYVAAYEAFAQGNQLAQSLAKADDTFDPYSLETVAVMRRTLASGTWRHLQSGTSEHAPAFLLGFPRSGTTLLDRMLDAHPRLRVLEETNPLARVLSRVYAMNGSLDPLAIDDSAAASLAGEYLEAARSLSGEAGGSVTIDKLPLNSVMLPLIFRLFPKARILFAVRDPRDVVFSCWAQAFDLNAAMQRFLSWPSTVTYYREVMSLALAALDRFSLSHSHVRYETLVKSPREAVEPALRLLDLDWEPAMRNYRVGVQGKVVDTPSYDQVDRPLYHSSIGRWRHYRFALSDSLNGLNELIGRLGYSDANSGSLSS